MSSSVQPWLEGLSDAWEVPAGVQVSNNVSSASHDATSIRNSIPRTARRSLSGLPSSLGTQKSSSQATTQLKRSPLAPLENTNTFRRNHGTTKLAGTRSISEASDVSELACGTVQQRSKSASPTKAQETLEWKRRLVKGQVGYGDQTDLFGPSGLENIFARSTGPENDAPKPKSRLNWLQGSEAPMPSSPPPWPSSFTDGPGEERQESLEAVREEEAVEDQASTRDEDGSFRSNPFDLHHSDESRMEGQDDPNIDNSSSAHALEEPGDGIANRTISGRTELEQEDFSPVFISKHTTVNGNVDYAALDSHLVKQFHSMKVDLRHPSQQQPSTQLHDESALPEMSAFSDGPHSEITPVQPDLSLSENLPTGTPPVASLGRHVELQRGGYSRNGSFKQRPLSPSPSKVETSVQQPSQLSSPLSRVAYHLPAAPTPPVARDMPLQDRSLDPAAARSAGSPLKLFGPHDTFTNNQLLRRMSQLNSEDQPDDEHNQRSGRDTLLQSDRHVRTESIHNSFGSGKLDDHVFDTEISVTSASDSSEHQSEGSDRTPGSEIPVPGSKIPLGFKTGLSSEVGDTFKLKRKLSKHSTLNSKVSTLGTGHRKPMPRLGSSRVMSEFEHYYERAEQVKSYDGSKRPPTSPFKNPTPKRRRTLHASELPSDPAEASLPHHAPLQDSTSSRKRKDARAGHDYNLADPDTLAQRRILRPRNPTPSQRRRQQIEVELREAAEQFAVQEPGKMEAVMEQIESSMAGSDSMSPSLQRQAEAVAAEVANFSLRIQKPSAEYGERKRSVTTQDFLNEAIMVMNLIRAKARPQSGLGSVEESDAEGLAQSLHLDESPPQEGAGSLRISRPPSREHGHSGWRTAVPQQTDARVVSHLRRFQERDDTEFIAESIASLHVDDEDSLNDNVVVVDEQANIRIIGPRPGNARKIAESESDSRPGSQRSQGSTLDTQGSLKSGGTSTGRTLGTSSTRKSDNVGMLAPDAVAHLIGEQVGGMTFDKETQRWLRVKSPDKAKDAGFHGAATHLEPPSQLTSDDDPFREISDLPVDDQRESRRISFTEKSRKASPNVAVTHELERDVQAETQNTADSRASSNETVVPRPVTRDSSHIRHTHSSSVPSRLTVFASSQQPQEQAETRATSWSDEELAKLSTLGKARAQPLAYVAAQATLALRSERAKAMPEETDEEVSALVFPSPPGQQIPVDAASVAKDALNGRNQASPSKKPMIVDDLREDTALDEGSDIEELESPKLRQSAARQPFPPRPSYRNATREISLRRRTLTNKFNEAEAHEQSEVSFVAALPGERMMSVSLSVSRPITTRHSQQQVNQLQSSPCKGESSWMLSDLPEFTVHEEDVQGPSERALATRLARHAAVEVDDRYALAVKELVKTLTDVQADEPFWEDLKQLDLRDRSLVSLYGLDDFCTRIQDMDVSSNALTHLEGAPSTIRRLIARSNHLSSLTCWQHLSNLQYLDISRNHLDSLRGLSHLVHLREICADDNQISDLDGITELDGLLKLRLRRNRIQQVDFTGFQLFRLSQLDLTSNDISSLTGLQGLPALTTLKLDQNPLQQVSVMELQMTGLTSLSMQRCGLDSLDVSGVPHIQALFVDDNRLANIGGLGTLKHLETLSMRRQCLPEATSISVFHVPMEARVVRLSGNAIPALQLQHSFLNLQELELASTGLQELPDDFGLRMPNLRSLNLNFNALKDLRPLLNIQKLETLNVCGNRLGRLRKSVATLAKMASLRSLDLRDNPVTQGFYSPVMISESNMLSRLQSIDPAEEDEHSELMEKAKHGLSRLDADQDRHHQARLDENTKLRRRVYELLLAHSCRSLTHVDGLGFDKASAHVKDRVWERLVELGIIRKSREAGTGCLDIEIPR